MLQPACVKERLLSSRRHSFAGLVQHQGSPDGSTLACEPACVERGRLVPWFVRCRQRHGCQTNGATQRRPANESCSSQLPEADDSVRLAGPWDG